MDHLVSRKDGDILFFSSKMMHDADWCFVPRHHQIVVGLAFFFKYRQICRSFLRFLQLLKKIVTAMFPEMDKSTSQ
jgi:hypothetical protein